jgi:hypothetical protein
MTATAMRIVEKCCLKKFMDFKFYIKPRYYNFVTDIWKQKI